MGFIQKPVMASSVAGLRKTSKAKLAPKKVIITIWWCTNILIHYSFLNPGKATTSEKYA